MRFGLLLDAPLMVQLHLVFVALLLVLGGVIFLRPKGTPFHKGLGKIWASLMIVTAIHSFFISGEADIIHLVSIWTLFCMFKAITAIRRGDIKNHRDWMTYTFIGSLLVAGSIAILVPGRLMNQVFF